MTLKDQVAVLTGASSGIGTAIARGLAPACAHIVLFARRKERLQELAQQLGEQRATAVAGDVCSLRDFERARDAAVTRGGLVHILINNAGIEPPELPTWELSPEDWRRTLDTNLTGVFHGLRTFLPMMIRQGYGRVVNISSAMVATPLASAYSVSKSGIDCLTAIVAQELAGRGVDVIVSSFDPGCIRSEMNPTGAKEPEAVVPRVIELVTLPPNAPNGAKWTV